jgi:hypothetical protein
MAVSRKTIPKAIPRPPTVVQARDPKVIAKEKARAALLKVDAPMAVVNREIAVTAARSATAAEIAEALRFAADAKRPATCMMAQIAAERIILHLEKKGFALVATDKKARKR